MSSTWCELGASSITNGALTARCKGGAIDEDGTAPDYGNSPMMCALGVTAMAYPPTASGAVEALLDRTVQGISGVVYAARDTRSGKIVGALKPGDTCVHSTGPQQAAMCIFKEEKRVAAILTKTASGKTMMLALDGTEETFQIAHPSGSFFEMSKNGDVSLLGGGGKGILIQGDNIHVLGNMSAAGSTITGNPSAAAPAAQADKLLTYLSALETLLGTISAATLPSTAAAVAAFVSATAAVKASIVSQFTKVS